MAVDMDRQARFNELSEAVAVLRRAKRFDADYEVAQREMVAFANALTDEEFDECAAALDRYRQDSWKRARSLTLAEG